MAREIKEVDLINVMTESRKGFGTAALVIDEHGVWPWYRRDYIEIRNAIELGFGWDSTDTAIQED